MLHEKAHAHITPWWVYGAVYAALLVLTWTTVAVAQVNLGAWNVIVAVGIATAKASLVALFFMHLLYESRLTWGYLGLTLFAIALLLGLSLLDVWAIFLRHGGA